MNLEPYLALGQSLGCPMDQMQNFALAGVVLQPRQLAASAAARLCDRADGPTAIGYGGARGGGKSHWLMAQMGADDCQRVPGLKCLLLRKVGKANLEHFEDLRLRVLRKLAHQFSAFRGTLTFANGSRIIAGHFQNESDVDAYLGLEYDVIGVEEATTLSERKVQDISTCCRSSKPNWRPRIYSTTNPGGIGHLWYRERFVYPFQRHAETDTRYIPATVHDNRHNNPEYRKILEGLSGWQRKAWLDGDWDIPAGQFFHNFRRQIHVIKDFDPSRAVEWYAAMDYGFAHYTVVLLACKDGDGNLFILDEHAQRLWLPVRHCNAISAMLSRNNVSTSQLRYFVAGADVFSRQSDGACIADPYRRFGFNLRQANMDRIIGWAAILQRLGDPDAGIKPSLFIHERCTRLLETLPNLLHDPQRPEDVLKTDPDANGKGGDDAADALRYLVSYKPNRCYVIKLRGA